MDMRDFDSSDCNSRWDYLSNETEPFTMQGTADCIDIPDDADEFYHWCQDYTDEELFAAINDDFESADRYYSDYRTDGNGEVEPLDIDGVEEEPDCYDFISVEGSTSYVFQLKREHITESVTTD